MSRILAIDYGKKRTGIAVTDVLQIIANGLTTVPTGELMDFILKYVEASMKNQCLLYIHLYPRGSATLSPNMESSSSLVVLTENGVF